MRGRFLVLTAITAALACAVLPAWSQDDDHPIVWSLKVAQKGPLRPGGRFTARLSAEMAAGWHIYSITQPPGGPTATVISAPPGQPFRVAGDVAGPKPKVVTDPSFNMETELYADSASFLLPMRVDAKAPSGNQELTIAVRFQACNGRTCLAPTTVPVKTALTVAAR